MGSGGVRCGPIGSGGVISHTGASTASTATPGMHEVGEVPTQVLRNEATLPLMCAGL